jgi:hypothetical protein
MDRQRESLQDETKTAIEEARMVLPGIQALFGFQLIAVFSDRFEKLPEICRNLHLSSIGLIVLSIVFVMAPAAFHRIGERGWVSRGLIDITSNFLTLGMTMLMSGLSVEFALVSYIVLDDVLAAIVLGVVLFLAVLLCWILLPWRHRNRR